MIGSRASTRGDLADVLRWTGEKKIKPMVSRHLPLREANDALEGLKKNTLFHRVVLKP
jgi:D-arabinose 1-dehydrogenase-like Zn-dependent alcohol dehydrogenase